MVLKSRFFLVLILVFSAVVLGSDPAGTPALSVQQKESATGLDQSGLCSPFLNDQLATRNPAAVYCLGLGYDYLIITDATGGQHGNCILPDQTECPAWDFLSGKCGQARSICAREGLETVTLSDGNDPFSDEYAVCADSKGKLLESVTEKANLVKESSAGIKTENDSDCQQIGPQLPPGELAAPSSFDWRDHDGSDWMTPVKDQGICGSCWAFSAVGISEAVINIAAGDPNLDLDLSEQYLVTDCALAAGSCVGGAKYFALDYIRDYGIPDEGCLPYLDGEATGCTVTDGVCDSTLCEYDTKGECSDYRCTDRCTNWDDRLIFIDSHTYLGDYSSQAVVKEALIDHGPVSVSMNMSGSFDQNDVYRCPSNVDTGHAVVIAGYDDAGGYWIVKNSWGDTWGQSNDGYFKVAYDNCAIQKFPYYADVEQFAIPGILVDPSSGLQTSEDGSTDSFTVVLASEPTAEVSIGLSSTDTSESGVSPAFLTFNSTNWHLTQTVTVTGVNDYYVDGDIPYTIQTAAAVSGDPAYTGIDPLDVSVTNMDDDTGATASLYVTPSIGDILVGDELTAEVMVEAAGDLYTISLEIAFDPSVVMVVDSDEGTPGVQISPGSCPSPDSVLTNTVDIGTGHIQYAASSSSMPCSSGNAASITFLGLSSAMTPVDFGETTLTDSGGIPIAHSRSDLTIKVWPHRIFLPLVIGGA